MIRKALIASTLLLSFISGCGHRTPSDSDLFNEPAAIATGKLPYNPFAWKVITSGIHPRQHTMSTLYGNDSAITSARAGKSYSPRAVLALVTWTQREDPHWFGGRIPGAVQSIEFVTVGQPGTYQRFTGPDAQPDASVDPQTASARQIAILAEHAAVMP
jgi:hypothetical protein